MYLKKNKNKIVYAIFTLHMFCVQKRFFFMWRVLPVMFNPRQDSTFGNALTKAVRFANALRATKKKIEYGTETKNQKVRLW